MPRLCNFFAPCAITCAAGYNAFPREVLARRIMGGAMNCGLSPEELESFLDLLAARVGTQEADAARTVARKVLASR